MKETEFEKTSGVNTSFQGHLCEILIDKCIQCHIHVSVRLGVAQVGAVGDGARLARPGLAARWVGLNIIQGRHSLENHRGLHL